MGALKRLIPYFRPYRTTLAIGLTLVIVSSALAAVLPQLVQRAIDGIRQLSPIANIWRIAAAMVVLALLTGAARYWMRELLNGLSRRIEYDLRNDLFVHLTRLDAPFFDRMRTGEIMARLTNDLSAVRMSAGPAIMYLVNTIAGGLFALYFMIRISGWMTLLALVPMIILPILTIRMGKAIHDRFEAVQEYFGEMTTRAQENLAGARIVRAYRQEKPEIERWERMNEEYVAHNMRLVKLWGLLNPTFSLLAGSATVIVLGVGGTLVVRGTISVGEFVAFSFYLAMLTWPLISLGWVTNLFQRGAASMARLNEILDARADIHHPPVPRELPPARDGGGRSIEFRNVGFHFPAPQGEEPRWVLRGISFRVEAGATLAVVGATGSGKSALLDLIPRFHDPQEGEILIDDVPIRELDPEAVRREIGYVPQETLLFSDTIRSNLGYGTSDDDAWREAAGVAQLEETIADFPGGVDTMLGERGINLSGGQKQRVALARALARRPAIVLLDDALSAVDTHTEAAILGALRRELAGRTAIIASHRVSAIRDAGAIIVLDEGRIVEQGRHEDLLALGGRYWALLRRQQLEESIEQDGEALASGDSPSTIGA